MTSSGKAICSRSPEWIQFMKNYPELCLQVTQLMMDDYETKIQEGYFCLIFKLFYHYFDI